MPRATIGAIIQARMKSQRFPGKVLYNITGKPMLQYLLEKIAHCTLLDKVVVATSLEKDDGAIADFCKERKIVCHRGPLSDVAGRFKGVLDKYKFRAFARLSADSPLLDQRLVDKAVEIFRSGKYQIVTNIMKRTYPKGQSVEVLESRTFIAGYNAFENAEDREHVTKFFYDKKNKFKIYNFEAEKDFGDINLSVDTVYDMNKVVSILGRMDRPHWQYSLNDVLRIYKEMNETRLKAGKGA